jgi:hypothetical protein
MKRGLADVTAPLTPYRLPIGWEGEHITRFTSYRATI